MSASFGRMLFLAILLAAIALGASPAKPKLWSLQPVVRPEVPAAVTQSSNPIDAFIAAQYKEKKLHPAGGADKAGA